MPKYLIQASYTSAGAKGLLTDGGTSRRNAVESLMESVGGKLESLYFAFGEDDVVGIVDAPSHADVAAAALSVAATGIAGVRTTVLLTPEEIDEAAKRSVSYRPPGVTAF